MQLHGKAVSCAVAALAMLAGCSSYYGAGAATEVPPAEAPPEVVQAAGSIYASRETNEYDEVGYASAVDFPGGDGIFAAHASLPVPSYAEVTNLNTGRTILVRISDRMPSRTSGIVGLSAAASRQLGVEGQSRVPVRVRRTNPPQHEKVALENGQIAIERIETPPSLLNALRKKLGAAPVAMADAKPTAKQKPPVSQKVTKPAPQVPVGADLDPNAQQQPSGGDRFVVEDGSGNGRQPASNRKPVASRQPTAHVTAPSASPYFIQIAAFSLQARATAVAKRVGAGVEQAGSIYRVRMGPYSSEAEARAALGGVHAKGYRDARVTR
jgi:rare lipoprotein A